MPRIAVRGSRTVETSEASAVPAVVGRRHAAAFWAVAFAFLIVMAFATLPSPLYGLYRTRYDLSTLTVTVAYAVFACGAIGTLLWEPIVVARIGRRGAMLGGVAAMMTARGCATPFPCGAICVSCRSCRRRARTSRQHARTAR